MVILELFTIIGFMWYLSLPAEDYSYTEQSVDDTINSTINQNINESE